MKKSEESQKEKLDRLETMILSQNEKLDSLEDLVHRMIFKSRIIHGQLTPSDTFQGKRSENGKPSEPLDYTIACREQSDR